MTSERIDHKEYHPNGELWISETRIEVPSLWIGLYNYRTEGMNGKIWYRTGLQQKFFDNGQLAWTLEYDEFGKFVNKKYPSYRKDGSL